MEVTLGQCSNQQQKVQKDKGRTSKDQNMCPTGQTTGSEVQSHVCNRPSPDRASQEKHAVAVPEKAVCRNHSGNPSSLKLRLILLALPIPYTSDIVKIPLCLF